MANASSHIGLGIGWQSDSVAVVEQDANGKPRIAMIAEAGNGP